MQLQQKLYINYLTGDPQTRGLYIKTKIAKKYAHHHRYLKRVAWSLLVEFTALPISLLVEVTANCWAHVMWAVVVLPQQSHKHLQKLSNTVAAMCTVSANFSVYALLEENEVTSSSNRHRENKKTRYVPFLNLKRSTKKKFIDNYYTP